MLADAEILIILYMPKDERTENCWHEVVPVDDINTEPRQETWHAV